MPVFKNEDNGTWYVMARYMNWKGERKQKCKRGFATKKEAQEWERMFQLQNSSDLDMSFEAFTELYINDVKNRLKENTWLTKEHIIRTKILPYFGKLKISEISTKEIITWQNEMLAYRDEKKKPYSQTYLKTLHNFATECKTVNGGLEEQIRGFMQEHSDTGLIIIDTLKRVREAGGADYSYASDYDIVARLKALADSYKVTMLIVHHTRKQKAEDIFDMISGTNGLMGAADGAFVLSKEKRTSNNATLDVAGRDQQDMKIHLVRDSKRLVWNFEKSETELWKEPPEPLLEKIAAILFSESNRWEGTASELCERLGVDIKPNVLSLRLSINASRLFRDYGIRYQNSRTHDGRKVSLWKETDGVA